MQVSHLKHFSLHTQKKHEHSTCFRSIRIFNTFDRKMTNANEGCSCLWAGRSHVLFLWHVVSVFAIIAYHIVLDRVRSFLAQGEEATNNVLDFDNEDTESLRKRDVKFIENMNWAMIYVFPMLTLSFYIIYFCMKLL